MRTDTLVKKDGYDALFDKLGMVDAERFITLLNRDPLDYTIWQKDLYKDIDVETLGKMSFEHCRNK